MSPNLIGRDSRVPPVACRVPDPCMHPAGAEHTDKGPGRLGRGPGEPAEQGHPPARDGRVSPGAAAGLCGTHPPLGPIHHKPVATRRQRLHGRVGRTGGPADANGNAALWGHVTGPLRRGCNELDAPVPIGPSGALQAAPSVGRLSPPCSGLAPGGRGVGRDLETELVQSWQRLHSRGELYVFLGVYLPVIIWSTDQMW